MANQKNPWLLDCGAKYHISNTRSVFYEMNLPIKRSIVLPDGNTTECNGRGRCSIQMINSIGERTTIDLKKVYFIPTLPVNILSVKSILKMGYLVSYDKFECSIRAKGGREIGVGDILRNGAFTLRQGWPLNADSSAYPEALLANFLTLPILSETPQQLSRKRKHTEMAILLGRTPLNDDAPSRFLPRPAAVPAEWPITGALYALDYYPHNISKSILNLYNEHLFFDVILISGIGNVRLAAHRIVLSSVSEYFNMKFRNPQDVVNEINLPDIDGLTMKSIVKSMYASMIELDTHTVLRIHKAAEFLKLPKLLVACCDFMEQQMCVSNCLSTALFAETHNHHSLQWASYSYACNHLDVVRREDEFLELNLQRLTKLISHSTMSQQLQELVFNSILVWVQHDKENRERLLINILPNIRFNLLNPKFILENRQHVAHNAEGYELICKWLQWHLSPKCRNLQNRGLVYVNGISLCNLKLQFYNQCLNIWSYIDLPRSEFDRVDFGATLMSNELVVAGGGINNYITSTVKCLNFNTMVWITLPSMRQRRSLFPLVGFNGYLYAVGGLRNDCWIQSVEKYDYLNGKWEYVAPMLSALDYPKFVIHSGYMYVMNATLFTMQCYDFCTNKWSYKAYKNNRSGDFDIASVGKFIYAIGDYSTEVERYDPMADSWAVVFSTNVARTSVRCAALNNRLIVCGGNSGNEKRDLVEEYNFDMNTWTTLAPLLSHALQPGSTFLFTT